MRVLLLLAALLCAARSQPRDPPYFNVALRKEITSTATCGQFANGTALREQYCELTLTGVSTVDQVCGFCDASRNGEEHSISYAVDGSTKYWQSPPLSRGRNFHEVNITINLGQEFHVAYVIVLAGNAPLPGHWVLERSLDGISYSPWQYFVQEESDCQKLYGISLPQTNIKDDTVKCTDRYSDVVPLSNGQMFISLVDGRPGLRDFSQSLREWTSAAYVRFRLLHVTTLFGELLDSRAYDDKTLTRRYYYSLRDLQVGGRCKCNGHGGVCEALPGKHQLECVCTHNTCGPSCSQCCEGFNQYKWRPSTRGDAFVCERCNCHGHSTLCEYDELVDQRRLSQNLAGRYRGGGVCRNCTGHTAGYNCQICAAGYYRLPEFPKTADCLKCNCSGPGMLDGTCDGDNNAQCTCKENVEGYYCDRCKSGFFNLDASNPDGCTPCACDQAGSMVGLAECSDNAACACKALTSSHSCSECMDGTYGLSSENIFGCSFCVCDVGGSFHPFVCHKGKGRCDCRSGLEGKRCDKITASRCLPSLHTTLLYEAEEGKWNDFRTPFAFNQTEFPDFTSFGYVILQGGSQESIQVETDVKRDGAYRVVLKYVLQGSTDSTAEVLVEGTTDEQTLDIALQSGSGHVFKATYASGGELTLTAGTWHVTVIYTGSSRLLVDQVILLPDVYYNPTILQSIVSDICSVGQNVDMCRQYTYPSLDEHAKETARSGSTSPTPFAGKLMAPITNTMREIVLVFNGLSTDSDYALIVSYYSQVGHSQQVEVVVESDRTDSGILNLVPCTYMFGCRQVATRSGTVVEFPVRGSGEAVVTLSLPLGDGLSDSLFIEFVHMVPSVAWTATLITPAFYCYAVGDSCVSTEYPSLLGQRISFAYAGDEGYYFTVDGDRVDIPVSSDADLNRLSGATRGVALLSLTHPEMYMDLAVSSVDDFHVVIHYYNPSAVSHTVTVDVDGTLQQLSLPYCPVQSGCRVSGQPTSIDLASVTLSFSLSDGEMLYVVAVALIPSHLYHSRDYISQLPIDLNARFVNECSADGFGVNANSSAFCMSSARTLSAYYNNGSHSCSCDLQGSVSPLCDKSTCGCQCKPNVVGLHCTQCRVGYFGFPDCRPCECTTGGICDSVTGQCLCPPNVRGRNCNQCDRRHYDFDSVRGCIPCNCDPVGSSGLNCNRRTGLCRCKVKFDGRRCDQCVAGKYGPPRCEDCNCNQKGRIGDACNQQTGQCDCKVNMGGRTCSSCRFDAFNYSASNPEGCQLCNCDSIGSLDEGCHNVSGQCRCKNNVVGLRCDQCLPNTYRLSNGSCAACDCDGQGSRSLTCDVRSGKCACRKFVRGRQCSRCLKGYYQLSSSGCKSCDCSEFGSVRGECNPVSGQCVCKEGTFGKRCDQCAVRHVVGPQGCRPCGYCTDSLMDALLAFIADLNATSVNISDFSVLVGAWNRLSEIRQRYNATNDALRVIASRLGIADTALGNPGGGTGLLGRVSVLMSDADDLEQLVNVSSALALVMDRTTTNTKATADDLLKDVRALNNRLNDLVDKLRNLRDRLKANVSNSDGVVAMARLILDEIMARDFGDVKNAADKALVDARNTLRIAQELRNESQTFVNDAATLHTTLTAYVQQLRETLDLAYKTISSVDDVNKLVDDVMANLDDLMNVMSGLVSQAGGIDTQLIDTDMLLDSASKAIHNATVAYNTTAAIKRVLQVALDEVRRAVYGYRQRVAEVEPFVLRAGRRSHDFQNQSDLIDELSSDVNNDAQGPISRYRATDFPNVTSIVVSVTRNASGGFLDADFNDLLKKAIASFQTSTHLLANGSKLQANIAETEQLLDQTIQLSGLLPNQETTPRTQLDQHGRILDGVQTTVGGLQSDIDMANTNAKQQLDEAQAARENVNELATNVSSAEVLLDTLISDLVGPNLQIAETKRTVEEISTIVEEMRVFRDETEHALNGFDSRLDALDGQLEKMSDKIQLAFQHARRVDIPVTFATDDSSATAQSIDMSPPEAVALPLAFTQLSMTALATKPKGMLFYMGEEILTTADRRQADFLAVELDDWRAQLQLGIGRKQTSAIIPHRVTQGSWYQIEVSRWGTDARISLRSLEDDGSLQVYNQNTTLESSDVLLNIGPSGRVLIGGVPADYLVARSVMEDHFEGCIDRVNINSQMLPLFAFNMAEQVVEKACSIERKSAVPSTTSGIYLFGLGYIAIRHDVLMRQPWWSGYASKIQLTITKLQTFQLEALVFFAHGDDGKFIALEVRNGSLVASFNNGGAETVRAIVGGTGVKKDVSRVKLSHDGQQVSLENTGMPKENSPVSSVKADLVITSPFYFGGVPDDVKLPPGVTSRHFQGCLTTVQVKAKDDGGSSKTYNLRIHETINHEPGSNGFKLDSCLIRTIDCATFSGSGFVQTKEMGLSGDFRIYMNIYPTQDSGVLLFDGDQRRNEYYYINLNKGHVEFVWRGKGSATVRDDTAVTLNEWTFVSITREKSRVFLTVGSRSFNEKNAKGNIPRTASDGLFIGGVAAEFADSSLNKSFSGRVHGLVVNQDVVNFGDIEDFIKEIGLTVELASCIDVQPASPPTVTPTVMISPTVAMSSVPTLSPPSCAASPVLDETAYHFDGQSGSRLEIDLGNNGQIMKRNLAIDLQLRTFASDGLVVFTGNSNLQNYVYVRLDKGKVTASFSVAGDVATATSGASVNDGDWHWVNFTRSGKKGSLKVDDRQKKLNTNGTKAVMRITTDFFVGYVSSEVKLSKASDLASIDPFKGCVRNLRIENNDGDIINSSSPVKLGSTEMKKCYQQMVEAATFDGVSYAKMGSAWAISLPFHLNLTIRSSSASGLLFSAVEEGKYVSLYINHGRVFFEASSGSDLPTRLMGGVDEVVCDSQWHKIYATLGNTEMTLKIDGGVSYQKSFDGGTGVLADSTVVYVGGLPETTDNPYPVGNFVGCMKTTVVIDRERPLLDAENSEDLNLNDCPVA